MTDGFSCIIDGQKNSYVSVQLRKSTRNEQCDKEKINGVTVCLEELQWKYGLRRQSRGAHKT